MEEISLKAKDGDIIPVEMGLLNQSAVLFARMQEMRMQEEENNTNYIIDVPEADATYLSILVKWMGRPMKKGSETPNSENTEIPNNQEQHVPSENPNTKRNNWNAQFFRAHRMQGFRLMAVAKRLEIESFLQIFGRLLHRWIIKKSPDQVNELVCPTGRGEETVNFQSPEFSCEISSDEYEN